MNSSKQSRVYLNSKHVFFDSELIQNCFSGKLKDGVNSRRILNTIRETATELNRDILVTHKDVLNIGAKHKLNNPERLHSEDEYSVELWVKQKETQEENPVLYFKQKGETPLDSQLKDDDFFLVTMTSIQKMMLRKFGSDAICIDSTHGTNEYGFQLTTVMCIDEFGMGFPVAYCISNRVDTQLMNFYFKQILSHSGEIQTKLLMSDDTNIFYNAWVQVMGQPQRRSLCSWHLLRNWKKNLTKVSGENEKKEVIKEARLILYEKDIQQFKCLLEDFISKLISCEKTKDFGIYFQKEYKHRTDCWAYCFRQAGEINTNNHVEAMHRVLKYIYGDGIKMKRMDKCLFLLEKLIRDKCFDRLIKQTKGCRTNKVNIAHRRHRASQNFPPHNITKIGEQWEVQSKEDKDEKYKICKNNKECNVNCAIQCNFCNVCIHTYSCSCHDATINGNMCQHIHAIIRKEDLKEVKKTPNPTEENKEVFSMLQHMQTTSQDSDRSIAKLSKLIHMFESKQFDEKTAMKLDKGIDNLLKIAHKAKPNSFKTLKPAEPANKKVERQQKYSSKRKSKRKINTIPRTSAAYKRARVQAIGKEMMIIQNSTQSDHTYM